MKIGETLPDFQLPDARGVIRSKAEFLNGQFLVLFFYPKDNTPGCTKEVCSFRDAYQEFLDAGCEVIGVSGDTVKSHAIFADQFALHYPILSDDKGSLRKSMHVPKKIFGLIPGRVTYIFDPNGNCIHITNNMMDAEKHVKDALTVIGKNKKDETRLNTL
jgi:peroxiredoxin Q/BCP